MHPTVCVSTRLNQKDYQELKKLADAKIWPISKVLQFAIDEYIQKHSKTHTHEK